jgi:hypothetical protein
VQSPFSASNTPKVIKLSFFMHLLPFAQNAHIRGSFRLLMLVILLKVSTIYQSNRSMEVESTTKENILGRVAIIAVFLLMDLLDNQLPLLRDGRGDIHDGSVALRWVMSSASIRLVSSALSHAVPLALTGTSRPSPQRASAGQRAVPLSRESP